MATALASVLPRPRHQTAPFAETGEQNRQRALVSARPVKEPPPYGRRTGFIPRSAEDFGDGGAFPEIHVAQYPLDMGRKKTSGNAAAIQLDSHGEIKYEAILGHAPNAIVHARPDAAKEKLIDDLTRPSEEDEAEIAAKTRAALESIVNGKIKAARPSQIAEQKGGPTYISYTPQNARGEEHNSGAKKRIIRMVEMPKDPLEPPKFKHKKVPPGPPSPPVPVMHSPPRKVTPEDQAAWKIPPCISNWKNAKGYTIPLDKRLAADGRGLQEVRINDNFAKLSEALYIAERSAREAVAARAAIQRRILENEKIEKEEALRKMAEEARRGRGGGGSIDDEHAADQEDVLRSGGGAGAAVSDEEEEEEAKRERDELRYERKRERDRKRHLDNYKGKKKPKIERDADRDIGERIALGEAAASSKETMYDQRLFNQTQGLASGYADDEAYNVYDKPLFRGSSANFLYKPKAVDLDAYGGGGEEDEGEEGGDKSKTDTSRFRPDRGFAGADGSRGKGAARSKPVEFERDTGRDEEQEGEEEADPFGLDSFLSEAKSSSTAPTTSSARRNPLAHIGQSNQMHAAGGGTRESMSNRSGLAFQSAGVQEEAHVEKARHREAAERDRDRSGRDDRDRDRRRERSRSRERRSDRHSRRDRDSGSSRRR